MPKQFIKVKINCDVNTSGMPPEKQECNKYDSSSNISNSNGDICRICHCEADLDNPLLSPCYCSGSLKYVHQSCLRQWLAASDTRSCELCKFNFILHTKIKPLSEWRRLEMSGVERRRLLCAILFHFVAAICVIWSLFVLIDRAAEEVQRGLIAWPFWTKLVVVAVGFTGGAVFMYIQCRQYLHLFSRWKAYNRIILVQNAPEKPNLMPPSTSFTYNQALGQQFPPQIQAHVEYNVPSTYADHSRNDHQLCYSFQKEDVDKAKLDENSSTSSIHKDDIQVEDLCERTPEKTEKPKSNFVNIGWTDPRMKEREILALDIQHPSVGTNVEHSKTENIMKKKPTTARNEAFHQKSLIQKVSK